MIPGHVQISRPVVLNVRETIWGMCPSSMTFSTDTKGEEVTVVPPRAWDEMCVRLHVATKIGLISFDPSCTELAGGAYKWGDERVYVGEPSMDAEVGFYFGLWNSLARL